MDTREVRVWFIKDLPQIVEACVAQPPGGFSHRLAMAASARGFVEIVEPLAIFDAKFDLERASATSDVIVEFTEG